MTDEIQINYDQARTILGEAWEGLNITIKITKFFM